MYGLAMNLWRRMERDVVNHWLYGMVMDLWRRITKDEGKPLVVWFAVDLWRRMERDVGKPLVVWYGYGSVEKNRERCRKTTGCMVWLWIYGKEWREM